jgi:lipoprotein NlpD
MLNKFIIIAIVSMALIGCFFSKNNKPVIIIDRSTTQESINPMVHPANKKSKKTMEKNESIPVTGKIIRFFSKAHQGLTFNTYFNQPVRAIRDGVVIDSEDKKDQGKMITIKHPLGFYSSYVHNQTLEVANGDKVKKGQIIAHTGKDFFYLEMKKFETLINPLNYLK